MQRIRRIVVFATLLLAVPFLSQFCHGQTTVWTNWAGGDFLDAANWTPGGPPSPGVDGYFSIPATYSVNLNSSSSIRDLVFEDGNPLINGGNVLNFNRILVKSDVTFAPDVVFENVSLLGDEFSFLAHFEQFTNVEIVNGSSLSVSLLHIDAPTTIHQSRFLVDNSSVSLDQVFVDTGLLLMSNFSCVVAGDCNVGIDIASPQSRFSILFGTFEADTLNVQANGRAILNLGIIVDVETGINVSDGGALDVYDDAVIDCAEVNVGLGLSVGLMRLFNAEPNINGAITVALTSELQLDTSTCNAHSVNLAGDLILLSDEGIFGSCGLNSDLIIESTGDVCVEDETIAGINGQVMNCGGQINLEPDCELTFFESYTGQNDFQGEGVFRFRGEVHPDDLGDSQAELIGNLNFIGSNVILTNQSTYFVNFIGSDPSDAHDKLTTDSSLLIQNAGLSVVPDPSAAYSFADGEVLTIIDVGETQSGQFNGMPEGAVVWSDGLYDLTISYVGGDGNDVTLTASIIGVLIGDVNLDGVVNLLDVAPFVDLLSNGQYQAEADINQDGDVDLLDVTPFVTLLGG